MPNLQPDNLCRVTLDDVLALDPCWLRSDHPKTNRRALLAFARKFGESATPLELLDALRGRISHSDLVWLLTRILAKHHPGRLVWWAADCAARAVQGDKGKRAIAIATARGVVLGTHSVYEASAAADAAYAAYAARAASYAAPYAAPYGAAAAAAAAAADAAADAAYAARAASYAAPYAAPYGARAAAAAAEREWQIDRLRQLLCMSFAEAVAEVQV